MEKRNIIMQKKGGGEFGASVLILGHKCYRCHHSWVPRNINEIPEICPKCKSPYWKNPKKLFKKGERKNGK